MRKPKQVKAPEFYVIDRDGYFFAGLKYGQTHWSPNISEARELTQIEHFISIQRWDKHRQPRAEYIDW
jgi:hypothetical protein